jgi:hypothetical protein
MEDQPVTPDDARTGEQRVSPEETKRVETTSNLQVEAVLSVLAWEARKGR